MGRVFHRIIGAFLTAVFIFSAVITGTYSWYSLQSAINEAAGTIAQVRLLKLQKLPDGTETDIPVPGAAFYLFTAEGEQIGGRYVTDEAGAISLRLPAGSYYFEEFAPPPGYTFDTQDGERILHYPFVLPENGTGPVTVTAYNTRLTGSLAIQKTVQNADGSPLSDEQRAQDFTFTVSFSDGGTYVYRKEDGTAGELASGGTLTLRHGETARFDNLPTGVAYTVTETEAPGYAVTATGHRGTIGSQTATAAFVNTWSSDPTPPEEPIRLTVEKVLAGEYPAADGTKEFEMTLILGGEAVEFALKPGEKKTFELQPGDRYEIREKDYAAEGYSQAIANGFGTAGKEDIAVTVTNTFTGTVMKEITGEKTWQGVGLTDELLPESITLLLKDGDRIVEEAAVTPDENGDWFYRFTVPKYDADGNEIAYTVEEQPIESFRPSYHGFDIVNTYLPPVTVTLPTIVKAVEGDAPPDERFAFCITAQDGAPMPEGVRGSAMTVYITGGGEVQPGAIRYTEAGVYTYTVTETAGDQRGWIYDTAVYTVVITVTEENGALAADTTITRDGAPAEEIGFVNQYDSERPPQDMTVVDGEKIWHHGSNPEENRPASIVVLVYGDGKLVLQRQITAADGWQYRFELPKYNDAGGEIVYTIDEAGVDGYDKAVDGYDLINTFREPPEEPDKPGEPEDPDEPDVPPPNVPQEPEDPGGVPPTGDNARRWPWLLVMLLSGSMVVGFGRKRKRAP